jgi:hypothetical protein
VGEADGEAVGNGVGICVVGVDVGDVEGGKVVLVSVRPVT